MADFSKFKIGNTSYNVKDANAGKSLSISGSDLSLKNAAGTAISTVTLPAGGGGKFVWFTGMSSNNSMSIQMVVDEAGSSVSKFQNMRLAANTGAYVFLVDGAFDASGTVYALTSIEKVQGVTPIEYTITFSGKNGKWVGQCLDTADPTTLTLNFIPSGGGSAESVIVLANAMQWPLQSSGNLLHLIYQGDPAPLLAIRNEYEGSIIPVSAYLITIDDGGGIYSHPRDLISLVNSYPVGTHFDLTVWLVEGLQSNQQHKITFVGEVDAGNTITLQSVSGFSQASVIGA